MAEGEVGWRGHFPEMIRLAMFWRCSSISGLPAATPRNLAEPAKTRRACQPKRRQYVPATRPYLHYGSADAPCQHSVLRAVLRQTQGLQGRLHDLGGPGVHCRNRHACPRRLPSSATPQSAEDPSATPASISYFHSPNHQPALPSGVST